MKLTAFIYLDIEDILEFHNSQLDEHGGQSGIRNKEGLLSAVSQPQATFDNEDLYSSVFLKAAAYTFFIAESQAFVDGNKRTGLMAGLTFLSVNGVVLSDPEEVLYNAVIGLSTKEVSLNQLAQIFEKLSEK